MNWFEWQDRVIDVLRLKAPVIGVDRENIALGGERLIPPCLNIHLFSAPLEGTGRLSGGVMIAGKMEIKIIATVPGSMSDIETQNEAMK
jgi:hypothetical protein